MTVEEYFAFDAATPEGMRYEYWDGEVVPVHGYPDLVFVCGEPEYDGGNPPVLLNPTLLVEVASPSTAGRDRGLKLTAYTCIASLAEYWMVEPDRAELTRVVRTDDGWALRFAAGLDATVDALGVSVALEDVYRLVALDA